MWRQKSKETSAAENDSTKNQETPEAQSSPKVNERKGATKLPLQIANLKEPKHSGKGMMHKNKKQPTKKTAKNDAKRREKFATACGVCCGLLNLIFISSQEKEKWGEGQNMPEHKKQDAKGRGKRKTGQNRTLGQKFKGQKHKH